jgi:2-polyprenyl-6-methoxyphenol hydroxylase-like FAD-dependent oxidoreductase
MEEDMARSDVLIVGAGPTGLVLALWLTKLGAKTRIIDKTAMPARPPALSRFMRERSSSTVSSISPVT